MPNRFASFLRSGNKGLLLEYYFASLLEKWDEMAGGRLFAGRSGISEPGGRINLAGQTVRKYGSHRSGWSFAVSCLKTFHHPGGTKVDMFADLSFSADATVRKVYHTPWIGFLHVPPAVPEWLHSGMANESVFNTPEWKQSVPHCKGIFTLSDYHARILQPKFPFPVVSLVHPTGLTAPMWDKERFRNNPGKKLVQAGWWLRKTTSIYFLKVPGYQKIVLQKPDAAMDRLMAREADHFGLAGKLTPEITGQVSKVAYLSDKAYDQLLTSNVVFLDLFDASANNAVIECIARATPLLVNPLEAVVEYLGTEYPLYFQSLEEASEKAENTDLINRAHQYLLEYGGRERLKGTYFRACFESSSIYQQLPVPAR